METVLSLHGVCNLFRVIGAIPSHNLRGPLIPVASVSDEARLRQQSPGEATASHGEYPSAEYHLGFVGTVGWVLSNQYSLVCPHLSITKITI
jgi:hypothetical protein